MKVKPYKKDGVYSYALGLFPTLELLSAQPHAVQRVLLSDKVKPSTGLAKIKQLCAEHTITIEQTDATGMERLSRSQNCYAIGVFKKADATLQPNQPHIVLVNPDDMGNLGTIMRAALGFGVHDLAIITPAADAYDPKTIRASMGAIFRLRVAHFGSFASYQAAFSNHNPYLFVLHGTQKLSRVAFKEPASFIFGNEGAGLPAGLANAGTTVGIEQSAAIDSLNLALAVGIVLYARYAATV